MIKIALLGFGRMGKKVLEAAEARSDVRVLFAVDTCTDTEPHTITVIAPERFAKTIETHRPDVIIDFSCPTATMLIAPAALSRGISVVTCTTGFSPEEQCCLKAHAERSSAALLMAPNITPGINVLMLMARAASRLLPGYDIQITDRHGKKKADRPSGTALKLAGDLEKDGRSADVYGVRAGGIVGVHSVLFAGELDQIEITHQSYTRDIFAKSALDAATSICGRQGYLEMKDILGCQELLTSSSDRV